MIWITLVRVLLILLGAVLGLWGASLLVRGLAARIDAIAARLFRLGRQARTLSSFQGAAGVFAGLALLPSGLFVGLLATAADPDAPLRSVLPSPWNVLTASLLLLGPVLLYVGWQFDPARGRRRCRRCWYPMDGLDAAPCPECGTTAASPAELTRTRRSGPLIVFGLLLMLAAFPVSRVRSVLREGWRGTIPTTVLILGAEYLPTSVIDQQIGVTGVLGRTAPVRGTLAERCASETMWHWQDHWLRSRADRSIRAATSPDTVLRMSSFCPLMMMGDDAPLSARIRAWATQDLASPNPLMQSRGTILAGDLLWVFSAVEARRNGDWLVTLLSDPAIGARALPLIPRFEQADGAFHRSLAEHILDSARPVEERELFAAAKAVARGNGPRAYELDLAGLCASPDPLTRRCAILGAARAATTVGGGMPWSSALIGVISDMQSLLRWAGDEDAAIATAGARLLALRTQFFGEWRPGDLDALRAALSTPGPARDHLVIAMGVDTPTLDLPADFAAILTPLTSDPRLEVAAGASALMKLTTPTFKPGP